MRHNIPASQSAYLMAFTKTQHRHNAEDLSQRTKETILQGLASLAPWQTPDALMSATCKNLFLNDVEKYRREVDDAKGYFTGNFAVPADQDRHEESLEDWVNDTDLPPHLKTILILRAADTSCAEIAHRFDCPVGTIYSHIHRAHGQLQKWVQEHPRSPSSDDDEPHLPLGVRVGQWTEPTDCGRRGFNPAGFDGLRSEQLDGKIPRGFDPERWRPQETSFYYGLRTSDGRYVPKTSDPGRRIPVTPALNAYYKARLQFAHWHNLARRKQSECYFECGCAAEQPCPEWLVEFVKYQVALEPVSKNRDAWWWSKSRMRATTRLAGPRYRCSACGCPIVPLKNSEQPRQPWRLVCCHRERPITGVSREWFCWEKEIRPIDCVKCGAPAPFLLTPAISFENTRVQLHPKPSWRHHVRSAHVEEYTPKMRSNLGVPTGGEAPLMDTIEADRELPVVFREWKLAAEGGELGT